MLFQIAKKEHRTCSNCTLSMEGEKERINKPMHTEGYSISKRKHQLGLQLPSNNSLNNMEKTIKTFGDILICWKKNGSSHF